MLEIPEGYEKEAGFGSIEVPYGETAQTIVSVKLKETQDDNEKPGDNGETTKAEIMTITEAMTITEIAVTEVMADPVHLVMVLPLPAVRPLFPKAEAGVRMKRVSG